jgi:predicted DsbA family dithiol-disulfide isomerase
VSPTGEPPPVVEVYADVLCPFTHVGLCRLVARRAELGLTTPILRVHAWPLEVVNDEPLAAATVAEEVAVLRERVAPDLFRGFDESRFPSSSIPALALAARAYRESDELGERASLAVRDALFERNLDISDAAVLGTIANAVALDAAVATDVAAVTADLEQGRARGVVGSPHFFVDTDGFFCPSLDIHRDEDDNLQVAFDPTAFAAFTDRCFGEPGRLDAVAD